MNTPSSMNEPLLSPLIKLIPTALFFVVFLNPQLSVQTAFGVNAFTSVPLVVSSSLSLSRRHEALHRCLHKLASISKSTSALQASKSSYDIIIVGGGSAGLTAAKFASTFGKSVALIESEKLGGDCTWTGCIPSKTLLSSAKSIWNWRKLNEKYGNNSEVGVSSEIYMKMLKDVKREIDENRQHIYEEDDSPKVMQSLGIDSISGRAFVVNSHTVEVTPSSSLSVSNTDAAYRLNAKYGIVIASGATPRSPTLDIDGLDSVPFWTYENVWDDFFISMEQHRGQPYEQKVIVVGGGPIGCELSQALSRIGCKVTIVAKSGLLPMEEPEVSNELKAVFENEGIDVVCGRKVVSVSSNNSDDGKTITAKLDSNESITGDHILVATGRTPNTKNMGLEALGVQIDSKTKGIQVNDRLETSVRGIFAAGDCTGDRQFTHYAGYQGAVAARNLLLPLKDPGVLKSVPSTIFTEPEVASVGLTEQSAIECYGVDLVSVSFRRVSRIDRAICENTKSNGFIKIVHHKKSHQILGSTIVAPVAGELISEIAVAMKSKLSFDQLATVMHAYPTYSMALQQMAVDVYYEKLKRSRKMYDFLKRLGL